METRDVEPAAGRKFDPGLLAIGLFKLVEAVFFLLVGVGAFHFLHSDLGDAAMRVVHVLRVDPESHLVNLMLNQLDAITEKRLREIGVATFIYAVLRLTEGVGLMMQKTWAEYMTVGLTLSFLPWEMYEVYRKLDWLRVGLLVINLIVAAYLVWMLWKKRTDGKNVETAA